MTIVAQRTTADFDELVGVGLAVVQVPRGRVVASRLPLPDAAQSAPAPTAAPAPKEAKPAARQPRAAAKAEPKPAEAAPAPASEQTDPPVVDPGQTAWGTSCVFDVTAADESPVQVTYTADTEPGVDTMLYAGNVSTDAIYTQRIPHDRRLNHTTPGDFARESCLVISGHFLETDPAPKTQDPQPASAQPATEAPAEAVAEEQPAPALGDPEAGTGGWGTPARFELTVGNPAETVAVNYEVGSEGHSFTILGRICKEGVRIVKLTPNELPTACGQFPTPQEFAASYAARHHAKFVGARQPGRTIPVDDTLSVGDPDEQEQMPQRDREILLHPTAGLSIYKGRTVENLRALAPEWDRELRDLKADILSRSDRRELGDEEVRRVSDAQAFVRIMSETAKLLRGEEQDRRDEIFLVSLQTDLTLWTASLDFLLTLALDPAGCPQ